MFYIVIVKKYSSDRFCVCLKPLKLDTHRKNETVHMINACNSIPDNCPTIHLHVKIWYLKTKMH